MKRDTALALLGGVARSVEATAQALRCTRQAVYKWPADKPLPRSVADKVSAAVRQRANQLKAEGRHLHPMEIDAITLE